MKTTRKFSTLIEMNDFLSNGVTVYEVSNCGTSWFIEYESGATNVNEHTTSSIFDALQDLIKEGYLSQQRYTKEYMMMDKMMCSAKLVNYSKNELCVIKDRFYSIADRNVIGDLIKNK